MPTATPDGSRTYGKLIFLPDPDCEKFAFGQLGMATSRAELRHMFATTSLDAPTARPAVLLTGIERYEANNKAFEKWMAEIAAFNAGCAAHPQSMAVPLSGGPGSEESAPVMPPRKRRRAPAPASA